MAMSDGDNDAMKHTILTLLKYEMLFDLWHETYLQHWVNKLNGAHVDSTEASPESAIDDDDGDDDAVSWILYREIRCDANLKILSTM